VRRPWIEHGSRRSKAALRPSALLLKAPSNNVFTLTRLAARDGPGSHLALDGYSHLRLKEGTSLGRQPEAGTPRVA
jgi:hypothetical protein